MLMGSLAITGLPISRYPNIAPPSVSITASYPGASAKTVEDSVTQIIKQNMTEIDGLIYMASTSDNTGNVSVTLTFTSGTNPDTAQVQVQNKLQQATPLLPQIVQLQGISVSKASSSFLMVLAFVSRDGRLSAGDIGDYLASHVLDPVNRVQGVGSVQVFDSKYAMRIWLNADKLKAYGLTPALCATLLRPVKKGEHQSERGVFPWFNRMVDGGKRRYQGGVVHILARPGRYLLIYLGLASLMALLFFRLPTAFLPDEDQGSLITMVQTPVGATLGRTVKVLDQVKDYFLDKEKAAVASIFTVAGWSFSGSAQNSGIGFVLLRDWEERKAARLGVDAIQERANAALATIKDATGFVFAPPPVIGLGNSAGFDLYLKDNNGQGHEALTAALNQFLEMATKDNLLANVRPSGQEDAPQFRLDLDAEKAASLGLSMSDINDTLAMAWGGRYIDDFIDR